MKLNWLRKFGFCGAIALSALPVACSFSKIGCTVEMDCDGMSACSDAGCQDHPEVCKKPTIRALACDLDHLEKHIDCYGSVTAKMPDVWGQARLTQYREDFEREMKKNIDTFELRLNGAVARADQSLFTYAQAINVAAAGTPAIPGSPGTPSVPQPDIVQRVELKGKEFTAQEGTLNSAGELTNIMRSLQVGEGFKIQRSIPQPNKPGKPGTPDTPAVPPKPEIPTVGDLPDQAKLSDEIKIEKTGINPAFKNGGINIEPTIELMQKKRYLDFLGQLRRENEGGDTADAPGYQLNLVRVPVSVLPGKHTDRGHGAEVTFTIDPVLGDDLLPMTFRRMVVNDITQQLGMTLTQGLDDERIIKLMTPKYQLFIRTLVQLEDVLAMNADEDFTRNFVRSLPQKHVETLLELGDPDLKKEVLAWLSEKLPEPKLSGAKSLPGTPRSMQSQQAMVAKNLSNYKEQPRTKGINSSMNRPRRLHGGGIEAPPLSFANGLDNKLAFPTSQQAEIYGANALFEIAFAASSALATHIDAQGYVHLPDVQGFLKEELRAAYEFLAKNPKLYHDYCRHDLVEHIRSQRIEDLRSMRRAYRHEVACITGSEQPGPDGYMYHTKAPQHLSKTAALAWCLIVDSALLNDRLIRDLHESATSKGVASPCNGNPWPQFYLPEPPKEERFAFKEYVKVRWPIHVFALDPMTQDQNISDVLTTRRETQMALALAFASGRIGTRVFTQYARKLDAMYETIAVNHTQVGFANGENTFGWRFYPRFQTQPTPNNFTVLVRDSLIGGPGANALMRTQRLEPGPRECVALVIMPSFVPYVSVDVVSNWFALANPKCKLFDHTQSTNLSRTVRSLERCESAITDADCYRNGELGRLQTRVRQLASRLPAQSMTVPVPIVNTLGGFEMFSNGTTDLSPELYGWYGAPGVSLEKDTTLFLVGDHFSALQSRVIVGNSEIDRDSTPPAQRMLSRQVMQVKIKAGAIIPVMIDNTPYVQAHLATPYGVSPPLWIPVVTAAKPAAAKPAPGYTVPENTSIAINYGMQGNPNVPGFFTPVYQSVATEEIKLEWYDPLGTAPTDVYVTFLFDYKGATLKVPCRVLAKPNATTNSSFEVVLDSDAVKAIAQDLICQIAAMGPISQSDNSLGVEWKSKDVLVQPAMPTRDPNNLADSKLNPHTHTVGRVKANGQLTVKFSAKGICCDVAPAAQPTPPAQPPTAQPKPDAQPTPANAKPMSLRAKPVN